MDRTVTLYDTYEEVKEKIRAHILILKAIRKTSKIISELSEKLGIIDVDEVEEGAEPLEIKGKTIMLTSGVLRVLVIFLSPSDSKRENKNQTWDVYLINMNLLLPTNQRTRKE